MRIGIGYDSHRLVSGRKLVLGGVDVPFAKGLMGHSDGDALCHAIIDALLGAMGKDDIGRHFPDTDIRWQGASSIALLKDIVDLSRSEGLRIKWIDAIIIAEEPKLAPYIDSMKKIISKVGISPSIINIKAKTNEGMGFIGSGEGIAAQAVCLVEKSV